MKSNNIKRGWYISSNYYRKWRGYGIGAATMTQATM
jgi:hypothetical protein